MNELKKQINKMKKVVLRENEEISLDDIREHEPIFSFFEGKLNGMLVQESDGWILRLGGSIGSTGYHPTRRCAIESGLKHGHEFMVNPD